MVSLAEIGYVAGFYEGEGSFVANPDGTGQHVSITQKDIEPLQKVSKLFGGKIDKYNGYYYLRFYGVECRSLILTIFTLLSARRRQQILKHKHYFTTVDSCINGHPYLPGSYDMIRQLSRGTVSRKCRLCSASHSARKKEKRKNEDRLRKALGN